MGIAFGLIWLTGGINVITLEVSKWVPNIGAVFKVIIMLAIGIGGIAFAMQHGVANPFTLDATKLHRLALAALRGITAPR
jgi:amino acid transporter